MAGLKFVFVGKLKESFFKDGVAHYQKKLKRFHKFEEVMVKDAPGKLPPADKNNAEGENILSKIKPQDLVIILDEFGERLTSRKFAANLQKWTDMPNRKPTFIIGGPFGISDEVKAKAHYKLRLSDMTLPHELARLVLMEQLYRAATIAKSMPYHHD